MNHTPTPLRRAGALLVAVLASFAFVAASCSSGSDESVSKESDTKETTTTEKERSGGGIASGILDRAAKSGKFSSSGFGGDVEECIGGSVIDSLGEDEAQTMADTDPSEYSPDQVDALVAAFNDCVPGEVIAPTLVSSFYEGMGAAEPSDSTMVDCVADAVDGQTGDIVREGIAAQANESTPELTLQAFDQCMPAEDITALLTEAFTSSGLTAEQAACVATALEGQISVSELAAAGQNDGSPELEAKVQAAAEGCR